MFFNEDNNVLKEKFYICYRIRMRLLVNLFFPSKISAEWKFPTKACPQMFIAALFTITAR